MIRQPIITVLGHVDHGKTSLLDFVRGTALANREAGNITQHIGATEIPIDTLKKICGDLLSDSKINFTIPGLLFIDTPGHEAFTNLRKRGGSISDLAVLVIDINQGIQPQTKEAIKILKTFKVPFVIAANKIDVLSGWKSHSKLFFPNLKQQIKSTQDNFNDRFYKLLGEISKLGFNADLYNKIKDYNKNIAIIPISAKTGEGIAELMALLAGLSQKFLEKKLKIDENKHAKGTILEIKEEKGMGTTADVIIYNGALRIDDTIVFGGINKIVKSKIRSLLKPLPLSEIRDKKSKFEHVDKVIAATGVKILAPKLDQAMSGSPFASGKTKEEIDKAKRTILNEIESVLIKTDDEGIILKADTLGSLEAAINLFKQKNIPIKKADIGNINKNDVVAAASNLNIDPLKAFVLGFNVKVSASVQKEAREQKVSLITDQVIYKVLKKFEEEIEEKKKKIELERLSNIVWPAKFRILPQYIFRQSNPAIFGIEVLEGKIRPKTKLIGTEGQDLGEIKTIEDRGEKLEELKKGSQAAISVSNITIGRQANGGDIIYIDLTESEFRAIKENKKLFSSGEINVLKEIAQIKRKEKETWGI